MVRRAEQQEQFKTYMVTPDKDFGQLVTENTFIYKPPHMGNEFKILGLPEIQKLLGRATARTGSGCAGVDGRFLRQHPRRAGDRRKDHRHEVDRPVCGSVENLLARSGRLNEDA